MKALPASNRADFCSPNLYIYYLFHFFFFLKKVTSFHCTFLNERKRTKNLKKMVSTGIKIVEDKGHCPCGYSFARENGTRCYGGTHVLGANGADSGAISQGQEALSLAANGGCGICPHGFSFTRDNGTRCFGGTHLSAAAEEMKKRQEELEYSEKKKKQHADHTDGVGREGLHCKGSSRQLVTEDDKKKMEDKLNGKIIGFRGTGICDHGYSFNRENGTRCHGGTHYINGNGSDDMRKQEGEANDRNGVGSGGTCSHGFAFNRDNGSRCLGGTHRLSDVEERKKRTEADAKALQKVMDDAGICDHGYNFNREGGTRCEGGTHFSNAAEAARKEQNAFKLGNYLRSHGLGICDHGFDFNRDNGMRCRGGSHWVSGPGTEGAQGGSTTAGNNSWQQDGVDRTAGQCPHGFGFNRDQGTRCYGGSHRKFPKKPVTEPKTATQEEQLPLIK